MLKRQKRIAGERWKEKLQECEPWIDETAFALAALNLPHVQAMKQRAYLPHELTENPNGHADT